MSSHREVAHNWAHQTGKHRRGANMFYGGQTIYSWGPHWPIATLHTNKFGATVVLYTDEKRSVSTSSHTRIAMRAVNNLNLLRVVDPGTSPGRNAQIMASLVAAKWQVLAKMCQERSRKGNEALELRADIGRLRWDVRALCDHFDLATQSYEDTMSVVETDAETNAWIFKLRERAAQRAAQSDLRNWQRAQERNRIASLSSRERRKEALRRWLAGKARTSDLSSKFIWCRVKDKQLQTSQGASVPLDQAKAVYALAKQCRAEKRSFADPSRQVGDFRGLGITHLGTIVIGCHRIPFHTARIAATQAGVP